MLACFNIFLKSEIELSRAKSSGRFLDEIKIQKLPYSSKMSAISVYGNSILELAARRTGAAITVTSPEECVLEGTNISSDSFAELESLANDTTGQIYQPPLLSHRFSDPVCNSDLGCIWLPGYRCLIYINHILAEQKCHL